MMAKVNSHGQNISGAHKRAYECVNIDGTRFLKPSVEAQKVIGTVGEVYKGQLNP
jgi:hypothetical protein